jgi:hypothetical protein
MHPRLLPALLLPVLIHAQTWSPVASPATDMYSEVLNVGTRLVALGTGGPKLSDDSGRTWRRSATGLPSHATTMTGASRGDTITIYATGKLYRSTDRGDTWQDWSEGFAPGSHLGGRYSLAIGDSVTVFLLGMGTDAELWRRTSRTPWVRTPHSLDLDGTLDWSGNGFLLSDYASTGYNLRLTRDFVKFTKVLSSPSGSFTPSLRNDTVWALKSGAFVRSADNGATWDSLAWKEAGFWSLFPTPLGFVTRRSDSLFLADPSAGSLRLIQSSAPYVAHTSMQGTRLVLTCLREGNLVSSDSGRTWETVMLPEAGFWSDDLLHAQGQKFSIGNYGVWSSNDVAGWKLEPGSTDAHTFWTNGTMIYGNGWNLTHRTPTGWIEDTLPPKAKGYVENKTFVTGTATKRWASNSKDLWSATGTSTRWTASDTIPQFSGSMEAFLEFGGRLWQTRSSWHDSVLIALVSRPTGTGAWSTHLLPHHRGVNLLAAGRRALWVGSDSGLFRSDDTGKTFRKVELPGSLGSLEQSALAVHGDTVAVTVNSIRDEFLNSRVNRTLVSLDGGTHWLQAEDTTLVASSFHIDSTGIYAGMIGRGLYKWDNTPSTGILGKSAAKLERRFVATRTGISLLTPNLTESVTAELYTAEGRLLLRQTFAPGTRHVSCPIPSGILLARLHGNGQEWTGRIAVP